ncbi:hypothetical protein OPT61_g9163 [Boeremia exigua]|uniref:Uncharacterized protein n=1 Tax=Boeremia exigua TaxID=749465 RepID=A0ACC2HVM6_9PLEO|nr:hypothetical protein OPT61_g9163 [Boeremia exigua]
MPRRFFTKSSNSKLKAIKLASGKSARNEPASNKPGTGDAFIFKSHMAHANKRLRWLQSLSEEVASYVAVYSAGKSVQLAEQSMRESKRAVLDVRQIDSNSTSITKFYITAAAVCGATLAVWAVWTALQSFASTEMRIGDVSTETLRPRCSNDGTCVFLRPTTSASPSRQQIAPSGLLFTLPELSVVQWYKRLARIYRKITATISSHLILPHRNFETRAIYIMMKTTLLAALGLSLPAFLVSALAHHTHQPSWTELTPIPLPRQEHTTVFLPPSTIAVLGGVVPSNDTSMIPVTTTPLMQFYSLSNNTWTVAPPLLRAMNHLNAAVVDGQIYVLGGLADLGEPEPAWRAVRDAFSYSPRSNIWSRLPNLPISEERGSAAVGVWGSRIILAGGMSALELSGDRAQTSVSMVSMFDTKKKAWVRLPRKAKYIPGPRDHAGAAVVDGKMYVLGGRDMGQNNVKDTVFVLDLAHLEAGWTTSEARMPTPRGGVAAGVVGRKVYVLGGEGNADAESGVFDEVEAYDTKRDRWSSAGTMSIARHGTYAVGVGRKVYVPGGGLRQSGAPVADFDVFEP